MTNNEHIAMLDLQKEIDRLNKVLKLNELECMAGGFCRGMATRQDLPLTNFDRKLLEVAGRCIGRIINQKEAEK
jgi:hypothetical protein